MTEIKNTDNQESRKATDILLALEEKINLLQKTIILYDFNMKMILDRVNKIHSQLEKQLPVDKTNNILEKTVPTKEIFIEAGAPKLEIATKPIINNRMAAIQAEAQNNKKEFQVESIENSNAIDPKWYQGKKIPIQQIVKDQHGKDIFMADVAIFTLDNKPMHTTKTTAVGKWQHMLAWGKYLVKITKKDSNDPNKVYEIKQEIFIPENSSPFKLKDIVLNR